MQRRLSLYFLPPSGTINTKAVNKHHGRVSDALLRSLGLKIGDRNKEEYKSPALVTYILSSTRGSHPSSTYHRDNRGVVAVEPAMGSYMIMGSIRPGIVLSVWGQLFFSIFIFMPDLACYQKVWVRDFYCPKMSL